VEVQGLREPLDREARALLRLLDDGVREDAEMIIRSFIVLMVFAAWLAMVMSEFRDCATRRPKEAVSWPDAPPEPDAGRGGYFGRQPRGLGL
jgi:hypothetical protein